jgi:hypothetical protein
LRNITDAGQAWATTKAVFVNRGTAEEFKGNHSKLIEQIFTHCQFGRRKSESEFEEFLPQG